MEQIGSQRNDICGILYRGLLLKSVEKIQVCVKSNTNFRCCNEDLDLISRKCVIPVVCVKLGKYINY